MNNFSISPKSNTILYINIEDFNNNDSNIIDKLNLRTDNYNIIGDKILETFINKRVLGKLNKISNDIEDIKKDLIILKIPLIFIKRF